MRIRRSRSFSALVSPSGIHAVEYRRGRGGLHIVRSVREPGPARDPEEAAERVASLLESIGGRGGRVSIAVTGFGSYHHILTLPAAPREILLPVAAREMRRFYPDLFAGDGGAPLVDFTEIDSTGQGAAAGTRELLVVGAPRRLVATFSEVMRRRGLRLEHWTILPLVMQRLYESFVEEPGSAVVLLMIPESPLLGFFHGGELRLFSEPHFSASELETVLDTSVEQVRRGELFLRQQFRGARVTRLLVAAEADAALPGVRAELRRRLDLELEPFGPYANAPGAVAALGAALDAGSERGLNLLPPELRPVGAAERWTRALVVASAVVLVAASAWWGWRGVQAERRAEAEVRALQESLRDRAAEFAEVRSVVEARQAHARRAALLAALRAEQESLPELLWPLQAAPNVRLDTLRLDRSTGSWRGTLAGTATAPTSAGATRAVDALYREYSRLLPSETVSLDRLSYGAPTYAAASDGGSSGDVALGFRISFIVRSGAEPSP